MRIITSILSLLLLTSFDKDHNYTRAEKNLLRQINEMGRAYEKSDMEKYFSYWYTEAVSHFDNVQGVYGGPKLFSSLADGRALLQKNRALVALSFKRPESILRKQLLNFDRQTILHCLLDDLASYDGPHGKSTSSGQTYAISEDGGKKWKFFPLWVIAEGNESKYLPYFDKSLMKRKPRY